MSKNQEGIPESKDFTFEPSACVEMMERMMGDEGPGCGCDPSIMLEEFDIASGPDEFFTKMFTAVLAMCMGDEREETGKA